MPCFREVRVIVYIRFPQSPQLGCKFLVAQSVPQAWCLLRVSPGVKPVTYKDYFIRLRYSQYFTKKEEKVESSPCRSKTKDHFWLINFKICEENFKFI